MLKNTDKILITGGHLACAVAVLDGLVAKGFTNIVWVGAKYVQTDVYNNSAEYKLITGKNIKFIELNAGKLWRKVTIKTFSKAIKNFLLIPVGFFRARKIIVQEKPELIISFGGFLALPIVIAAKLSKIKVVTHEQTITVGLANKIISKFADKIFISFKQSVKYFPSKKVVYTGLPLRKEIFTKTTDFFKFKNNNPVIYVTGGNQGANTINWRLFKILPQLLGIANVIHQVGASTITNDLLNASQIKNQLTEEVRDNYYYYTNSFDSIGEIFSKANIILSRSGANTVYEIMALGKLAVLIPIPWSSGQEQLLNAKLVASTGLGFILDQYDAMPPNELYQAIINSIEVYKNKNDFMGRPIEKAVEAARAQIKLDAVDEIIKNLI